MDRENKEIERFIQWGIDQPLVRGMILTSTRAVPGAPCDILSDYDIILAISDVHPFHESRTWLEAFGRVLVLYHDPLGRQYDLPTSGYVIQFEDGLKIDFNLWSAEIVRRLAAEPVLDPEFDAGYLVLLDKDHLTDGLKPPTHQAYIPKPPTEGEYLEKIENFFVDSTYVAKFLWRDDVIAAKYILEQFMRHENLLPMLEWHLETEHQWKVRPGLYGRQLRKWLRSDLLADLENTYTGAGLEENWEAMFKTIALLRKVAVEVGDRLGYTFPHDMHQRSILYLQKVKKLDHKAEKLDF